MTLSRSTAGVAVLMLALVSACSSSTAGTSSGPAPVALPISAAELSKDLFVFASDSFAGRETGSASALKAARFIADRLMSLGIEPAGDSLYYQRVPLIKDSFGPATRFTVSAGQSNVPLALGTEVSPLINLGPGAPLTKRAAEGDVFFAGYGMVTQGRQDFAGVTPGKVIVIVHAAPKGITDTVIRQRLESQDELGQRIGRAFQMQPAAIILLMDGATRDFYAQAAPELLRSVTSAPGDQSTMDSQRQFPMVLLGLARPGSMLLPPNWPNDDAPQMLSGRHFVGRIDVQHQAFTAYNVVGVVRGTDPRMNTSYVAVGAHYDHIGIQSGMSPDSIANGADDDGSGSVTMLALAKSLKNAPPKRSTLFVWHVGEEKGLLGSAYFTDHPTVPLDSVVAQLNADMIGRRGGPSATFNSQTNGASMVDRLYIVGPQAAPNNQSKVLGGIVDSVNAADPRPMVLDHEWDSPTHPERIYFRSDHFNYARKGIPIVFFTTGLHEDYHKVSDEPQKIDYDKMARIGTLLRNVAIAVGNRETRPR